MSENRGKQALENRRREDAKPTRGDGGGVWEQQTRRPPWDARREMIITFTVVVTIYISQFLFL